MEYRTLGRTDEIVPPGTTVNPADNGCVAPALREPRLRRRPSWGGEVGAEW
jgi:hypothetical protein